MDNVKHLQTLILVAFTAALKLTCDPGEEFKSHNLTCDISQCNGSNGCVSPFVWRKRVTISTCFPSPKFSPSFNCTDLPSYPYNVDFIGTTYILNIMNVTRQANATLEQYTCSSLESDKQTCNFSIFARPESITCQDPLIDKSYNIKVSCTATKIYPSPVCRFYWRNGTNESPIGQNITYQNMSLQGDPPYYNPTCILTQTGQKLGLGSHQFRVNVYPNVTGSFNDTVYGRDSGWTTAKTINNPTVRLECPQDYIQENKLYSCSCKETNNIFVSANITLGLTPANQSSGQGNITYTFTAIRDMGDITCQAALFNLQSSPEKYIPKVAYGPNNATLIYNQTSTNVIHLCNNTLSVTVICEDDGVSPGVVYRFNFNESVVQTNNISTSTKPVTNGGQLSVFCTVTNSVFNEMAKTSTKVQLQVIAPPPSAPIIEKYQEGSSPVAMANGILRVQEGTNKIRCRVDGGYPLVSSLTVTCGSQTLTEVGNVAVLDVNMNRYDDNMCSCIAVHISTCYTNNKTTTKLDVQFVPAVLSFIVSESTKQEVIEAVKDSVMFSCLAEGNPSPDLSIIKDGVQLASYSDPLLQKFNLSLKFNKTIKDCRDAGVYSCQAKAGQNVANEAVDVNVICPQQLDDPTIQNKVYKTKVNGSMNINISVIGHPAPQLELYSVHPLNKEAYSLTYARQRPSFGFVYLKINTVTIKDFQKYSLNISNSEGTLVYKFEIQEGDPNKQPSNPADIGAIVGGIAAGVLVILLIAIILMCLKRKKKICYNKHDSDNYNSNTSLNRDRDTTGKGRKQGNANDEDVFDNTDLYNLNRKPEEVVFDNSDLYNLNRKSEEVVFDNSDLYNLNKKPNEDKTGQDSLYRSYSTVTPTITSASTAPKNMTIKKTPAITTAYEDVSIDGASSDKTKPFVAIKPKPKPRPKSGLEKNPQSFMVNSKPEETYATVVKVAKPHKPEVVVEEKRPSIPPEIPDKSFENNTEDGRDSKLFVYNNMGFSKLEDEHNVYANQHK